MGSSKGGGQKVYDFLMSIHYGLCHGPIDQLNKVWIKDKSVICGAYSDREDIAINQPELFGGDDGEGGVVGTMEFYPGTQDQVSSDALASRVGRTSATMPGYRGLASIFFRGGGSSGWRWTSNNPYLPGVEFSVTRNPTSLGAADSQIFPVANTDEEGLPVDSEESWITFSTNFENKGPVFDMNSTINPATFDGASNGVQQSFPISDWENASTSYEMIADQDDGGANFYWIARAGFGSATAIKDYDVVTEFGADVSAIDAGQLRLTGIWSGIRAGGFSTGSFGLNAIAADGAALGNIYFRSESIGSGEPQFDDPFTTINLPPGTRYIRCQVSSQNQKMYPRTIQAEWNGPIVNYCDPDDEGLRLLPNANPAHIIHEVMTNTEWGKGEDPARMDTASMVAAAATYKSEYLGLAFTWVRQGSIEDFIQNVLDHTNSMFFLHPRTGLWTLKPLRDDYDTGTLRLLNQSNCTAMKRKRRAWGETVNEIIVKYTDPQSEEEATVTSHNLANIAIQGGVISETRPYPGIRDEWVARRIAERDVIEAGYPLYSAEIEADRSFWDVVPGDVLRFSWPEDGIAEMVVRVMKADYGSPTDRMVKLSVVEDVFSLEQTAFGEVQNSEWVSDRANPEPFEAEMAMAAPLPLLIRSGFDLTEINDSYPIAGVMLLGSDDQGTTVDFAVHTDVTKTDGSSAVESVGNLPPVRSLPLPALVAAEATTTMDGSLIGGLSLGAAEQGDFLLLGDSEANQEIAVLGPYDALADTWTVNRGAYDTVPVEWTEGARLWFLPEFAGQNDPTERAGSEVVTYRLLPRTSEGRLAYSAASNLTYTATERAHLPFRPANTQIDGNGFDTADYTQAGPTFPIPTTWAERDRTVEDQVALKWEDATVTPETGQTTVIRVFDDQDVLAGEVTGLTGTSHDMTEANFFGVTYGYLEFVSERDTLRSRPGARRWFDFRQAGYGLSYGVAYG